MLWYDSPKKLAETRSRQWLFQEIWRMQNEKPNKAPIQSNIIFDEKETNSYDWKGNKQTKKLFTHTNTKEIMKIVR